MDLAPSDEQVMLRDSIARLLDDHVGAAGAAAGPLPRAAWRALAELGAPAFLLPERGGGLSGRVDDAAIVAEALGRGMAITATGEAVVGAGGLLARHAPTAEVERWVAPLVAGDHLLALTTGSVSEADGALSGSLDFVRWAPEAAALVIVDGDTAFVVPADAHGLTLTPVRLADGTPAAMVVLDGVAATPIRLPPGATAAALARVDLFHAAELTGLMAALLAQTNDYIGLRQQFGAAIGTFQAVQHRLARMFVALEQARSSVIRAAATGNEAPDFVRVATGAKAFVADAAQRLAEDAVQLHGGIGVTDELAVGRALRRVMVLARLFGSAAEARRRLAV